MDHHPAERRLHPTWAPELVVLSYSLSWLGAYTCTQVAIHAKYAATTSAKWWWTFLGSVVFGFSAIWCMHFVGMLACRLDVDVRFNIPLTILSALVSVGFTFLVLASGYVTEALENSKLVRVIGSCTDAINNMLLSCFGRSKRSETGYLPLNTSDAELSQSSSARRSGEEEEGSNSQDRYSDATPEERADIVDGPGSGGSSSGSNSTTRYPVSSGETLVSSVSWSDSLNASLSQETRMRVKLQSDKTVNWGPWLKAHYDSISFAVAVKAAIWGAAVGFMHYCGMWAIEIPGGRIEWNGAIVALSFVVAFIVCFIGCIAMVHMEVHFVRQVVFSTLVAAGSGSMHYIGMAAATIYTTAPPSPTAGYPAYLPFVIVGVAVFVCVVSIAVLAHSAIISRYRLEEMIVTKRRLWRIMAEKEAAEQANELKQQFISVASHEIRTPLHAVNGYCELLALTNLTEEQKLYLSSIQQACHAINVIAGNVLDFSKLNRNNVELSARPVLIDLRKMLEDQARITETKGTQTGHSGVDVVVAIDPDVPQTVYLDETYTFRILMNLLSNAQKFCEDGYICVKLSMQTPTSLVIQVSDTGCGIPTAFRPSLFQPFRQAHTTSSNRHGTGLGLSIVKHLVQRMNGTIDYESVEGEGTTFTVTLPVTVGTANGGQAGNDGPASAPLARVGGKGKEGVLKMRVVYSNDRSNGLWTTVWPRYGCEVVESNADASYEELVEGVDAIWTDVESVKASSALHHLIQCSSNDGQSSPPPSLPVLYIIHSNFLELTSLGMDLTSTRNVILIKRPVVIHTILSILADPKGHLASPTQPPHIGKVRFVDGDGDVNSHRRSSEAGGRGSGDSISRPLPVVDPTESPPLLAPGGSSPFIPQPPPLPPRSLSTMSVDRKKRDRKTRILLVEDNMVNQHLGKRLLEKLGYEVVTASDGQQAVDAVKKTKFACCLMDCQMPVLDGFAATVKIREMEKSGTLRSRLPIVALTANVTGESEDRCRAAGMDHFLPKPLRLADLDATIRDAISPPES
ncbi:histidine kinase [Cristinia sonorae]|uniref:histidine kinase n=1 Tax=Cristinia sonorae TaxID=1940300 RepID=A0A8K0UPD5_9AGAR|nr:histidine kinase [Cristinia sonorae]